MAEQSIAGARDRAHFGVPKGRRRLIGIAYVLIVGFMLWCLGAVLVENPSVFSASAITTISTALLTVEGILIGLSLLEEAKGRTLPTFVALIAIMWSIITITTAQILSNLQTRFPEINYSVSGNLFIFNASLYEVFLTNVAFFVTTLVVYVVAVASFRLFEERNGIVHQGPSK